ncbi:MAG: hypothetical protein QOE38_1019 [Thermoleophilaceae bacterium]|nr:hypothetical protein [Thermoleophilaceae bacterium]
MSTPSTTPMQGARTGTVLVSARRAAHSVPWLDMRSDAKEIPDALDGSKPVGWWLSEEATFTGRAAQEGPGTPGAAEEVSLGGTVALAVFADRVIGIVSPNDFAPPAVWFSWPRPSVAVETSGTVGLIRKRPRQLALQVEGHGALQLTAVSSLLRSMGSYQAGQEGSLLKALRR